jgi:DNA-binding NarL/FixJ family response regulator
MPSWTTRSRILIADDHSLVADGIASLLRPEFDVIGFAADGRQLLSEAERLQPDLITLDIGMPNLNGLEAAKQVRKLLPRVKLVFVTQLVDLRYLRAALAAGAGAFVAKQSASTEVLAAVREVIAGRRYITPILEEAFSALTPAQAKTETKDTLTPRQRQVLQLVAEGHTTKSIAEALEISSKTVEFHKDQLMTALGMRTTAELTRYAINQGIISA